MEPSTALALLLGLLGISIAAVAGAMLGRRVSRRHQEGGRRATAAMQHELTRRQVKRIGTLPPDRGANPRREPPDQAA